MKYLITFTFFLLMIFILGCKNTPHTKVDPRIPNPALSPPPHDTTGFRKYIEACNDWKKEKEAKVKFITPKNEGYEKDLETVTFSPRHENFNYKISDSASTTKIPPAIGTVNFGSLTVDKAHGMLRIQESVLAYFGASDVTVSSNFVIIAGMVKGTEANPEFAFALAPAFVALPPNAQISLSGNQVGNLDEINTDVQVCEKPYNDGGVYSIIDQSAREQKILIETGYGKNSWVLIKEGNLKDNLKGIDMGNGRSVVSSHYLNSFYDLHYDLYLFSTGLKLDKNGLVSGKLIFGANNSKSRLTTVVFK